ncbi:MAG: DUF1223 domain-containing protein [Gammaproteobacteria bacterium]
MLRLPLFLVLLTSLVQGPAMAETSDMSVDFSSGEHRVAMVELFTSEGCSSCPPADRWLSDLKTDPDLWKKFTPIGFHVDYWDYIGWKDRFARRDYGDRQRRYAAEGGVRVVYTPGVFNNGLEWRDWRDGNNVDVERARAGVLSVSIEGDSVELNFALDNETNEDLIAHVAILGMNLESDVRAGENRGRTLRHDFVALGVTSVPLRKTPGGFAATTTLPEASTQASERALVAWVTDGRMQRPLQSVGGYLPEI